MNATNSTEYTAVVQSVIPNGIHGPYVVATSDAFDGSVTFSLDKEVWGEADWPDEGIWVVLKDVRKKQAGWLAKSARYLRPGDEQKEQ